MSPPAWRSSHPGKAAAERWYLIFTPIWGAVAGLVMLSGAAQAWRDAPWGDLAYMAFGAGLWIALLIGGYALAPASERATALRGRGGETPGDARLVDRARPGG